MDPRSDSTIECSLGECSVCGESSETEVVVEDSGIGVVSFSDWARALHCILGWSYRSKTSRDIRSMDHVLMALLSAI